MNGFESEWSVSLTLSKLPPPSKPLIILLMKFFLLTELFLFGFSQGSLLSMCYALERPSRVAGVIAQSGYIPQNINLEIDETDLKNKAFLLTHGEQDTMIPIKWGRASRDYLQKLGVDLTYYEFQRGHAVSMDSLEVFSTWLEKQFEQ
jgi:phospholipase/carboxylesterase